jgi:hypothetical protein
VTHDYKKMARVIIPILVALLSVLVLSKYASSADFHAKSIAALDDKKTTVMELTAASTAASAAITFLPGDTATPIADKLADLSGYFLIVLCAILLEKYLLTTTGFAAFGILIPAACVLISVNALRKNEKMKLLAEKMIVFGLAIFLVVPASVGVSNFIEDTYNESIELTIAAAKEATDKIEESSEAAEGKDEGFFSSVIDKVQNGVSDITARLQAVLNNFIEALAVLLVTSCVIPIVVLLFFVGIVKNLLGGRK